MPSLSPWNIFYPDQTTGLTPLASKFVQMAQTVSDALTLVNSGTIRPVANSTARDALFPSGVRIQGSRVLRLDLGYVERYYTAYNASTNPGGATPAGWYPEPGSDISDIKTRGIDGQWTVNTTQQDLFAIAGSNLPAGKYDIITTQIIWCDSPPTAGAVYLTYQGTQIGYNTTHDLLDVSRLQSTIHGQVNHTGGTMTISIDGLFTGGGLKHIGGASSLSYRYIGPNRT